MKSIIRIAFFAFALFATQNVFAQDKMMAKHDNMKKETMQKDKMMKKDDVTVIHLTQTTGEFDTQNLNLKPGKYIFEVTNQDVDHEVAFMLVPSDQPKAPIKAAGLPGLLNKGETGKSQVVELTAGTYLYNCPLNPTPQYTLTVQ